MKKIVFVLAFLLMMSGVMAQEIGIYLIEYHPDSYYTRLQIQNNAGRDLNDVVINVGGAFETSANGVFKNGELFNAVLNIPPGEHLVTVSTKEGVSVSEKLYFSLSKQEVKEVKERELEAVKKEEEKKKLVQRNLEESEREIKVEVEKAVELGVIKKGVNSTVLILGIIGLVIGVIIIYWLISKNREESMG